MREAVLYDRARDGSVVCNLCAHRCLIRPGRVGICRVRLNEGGALYTLVYDRVVSVEVDPIEKKPLFHFLPGTRSFSIATMGCNFHCHYCQNWQISQAPRARPGLILGRPLAPSQLVRQALDYGCATIAYTYTEPTVFFELAYDTARLAAEHGLRNIFVTNGYMTPEAIKMIRPHLHAANVDLKGFDDQRYRRVCGARLDPVLEAIRLMKESGIWVEVTTLVVPGHNSGDRELRQIARFIASVDVGIPWHLSAFYPAYKMLDVEPTDPGMLERAWHIGRQEGLRYVYCGNVPGNPRESTYCYACGRRLVERWGLSAGRVRLRDGICSYCGAAIDGVWDGARTAPSPPVGRSGTAAA